MTFEYNGKVVQSQNPANLNAVAAKTEHGGVFDARAIRIIAGSVLVGVFVYFFWNHDGCHTKFWQVLVYSGLFLAQSIAGECLRKRAVRRGAVVERGSRVRIWLTHFVTIELLSIFLSFAEIFLLVALSAVGFGVVS